VDNADRTTADSPGRQVLTSAVDLPTPVGPASLALDVPSRPVAVLVLGHGAGGDIDAADLLAVRDAALPLRISVIRLRQPYRVAGRRAPAPAAQLDQALAAVLRGIADLPGLSGELPLLVGGRSSGARVAARGALAGGASGLLALAFPLSPPGRPGVSRLDELTEAGVPTLVIQGARDPFGTAKDVRAALAGTAAEVAEIPDADHSFRTRRADPTTGADSVAAVAAAAASWLRARVATA
jgi:predicted alpha/beta-hydrolase family hydrolase